MERANVFKTEAFKLGFFEVQDGGSQEIAPFCEVKPKILELGKPRCFSMKTGKEVIEKEICVIEDCDSDRFDDSSVDCDDDLFVYLVLSDCDGNADIIFDELRDNCL